MHALALLTIAVALGAAPAFAQSNSSQHPRVGRLATLTFAVDSAELTAGEESRIGEVAAWFEQNPDGHIVLDSHADRAGRRAHNQVLSLRRAAKVHDMLVGIGVDPDRIVVTAFGERSLGKRHVVVYGTRVGLDAITAWARARGTPVIRTGIVARPDRVPQPGALTRRDS